MTPVEKPIIDAITAVLGTVTGIKEVFPYPLLENQNITKYPAVIFFPDAYENSFDTVKDNFEIRRFKLFVVVGANQTNASTLFTNLLPKTIDSVIAAFNNKWNQVGVINGHRTWLLLSSGSRSVYPTTQGLEAVAEFTLDVKLATVN